MRAAPDHASSASHEPPLPFVGSTQPLGTSNRPPAYRPGDRPAQSPAPARPGHEYASAPAAASAATGPQRALCWQSDRDNDFYRAFQKGVAVDSESLLTSLYK